jgi:Cytochrome P450
MRKAFEVRDVQAPVAVASGASGMTHATLKVSRRLAAVTDTVKVMRNPLEFLRSLPARGDLVEVRLGPFKAIVVCDPGLTHEVLVNDRVFDKGGPIFEQNRKLSGNGLLNCPHAEHRRQRRLAQPAFQRARLADYADAMQAEIDAVVGGWHEGQILDVLVEMTKLSQRIVLATIFSDNLPASVLQRVQQDMETIFAGAIRRIVAPAWVNALPLPANRRFQHACENVRRTLESVIAERRSSDTVHNDLLSALMTARDEDGGLFSDTELIDQAVTFFIAGSETSASALSWALWLLADHPQINERVRAELDSVLAGRSAGLEDIPELDLTGRVITETLRLYAPTPLVTRRTTTGTTIGGHPVPSGTTVVYSPYLIQLRGDLYPDPERFDPDRPVTPGHAYIPFGAGARKCIGAQFAMIEAVLALAGVIAAQDLEIVQTPTVKSSVFLRPQGLRMRVRARVARS